MRTPGFEESQLRASIKEIEVKMRLLERKWEEAIDDGKNIFQQLVDLDQQKRFLETALAPIQKELGDAGARDEHPED